MRLPFISWQALCRALERLLAGGLSAAVSAGLAAAATGDLDAGFAPQLDGPVISAAVQRDGKVLIGGGFTRVGNANREWTARLNGVTGSLDSTFTLSADPSGLYGQSVLPNGNLLVYGNFSRIGSVNRSNMALLTSNGALMSGFNPSPNASVLTVQPLVDGRYFVGGSFSQMGNQSRRQTARLQSNGALDGTFNLPANQSVLTSALLADGRIVIGGSFTTLGGEPRERMARLEADGTMDPLFTPVFNDAVFCLAIQPDGRILAGGSFTSVNGTPRRHLARLHPDGSLDEEFNADLTGSGGEGVFSLLIQCDGRILFSGNGFSAAASVGRTQIARVDPGGRMDPGFNPHLENPTITSGVQNIFTTLEGNGDVLVSGDFSRVNGQSRRGLARLKNDPAVVSLIATVPDRLEWRRGGSAPEIQRADFELSKDGGRTWTFLGRGSRIAGGWALSGLSLPSSGHVRASATVQGANFNASASMIQTVAPFAAPTRVLAVHDGPSVTAPVLTSGQAEAVAFGETRQPVPVIRAFTFANAGTASLQITEFSVPAGFRFFNVPLLPFELEAGQSLTLPVQLTSTAAGDFEGAVVIQSTADASLEFKFPVTGRVTSPEIALFTASQAGDQEVISGQANPIDFGPSVQGVPGVRFFSLLNQGSAPLLLQGVSVTDGYEIDAGVLPRLVAAGDTFEFQVRLMAIDAKSHAGSVRLDSDDLDESAFEFPVVGEVVLPVFLVEPVSDRPALNPQTGLLEQTIRVSNGTAATVPGYQLTIRGLPPGVTVANATGTGEGGTALVLVRQPLGPHGQALLVLEYRVAGAPPETVSPEISAEVVPVVPDDTVPNLPPYAEVQQISRLADGSILLEILSAPNSAYEVQYSSDGAVWRRSPASLPATGSRTLWLDRGPPRTDLSPAVDRTRFYRVRVVLP